MEAVHEAMAKFGNTFAGETPFILERVFEAVQAEQNKKYGGSIKVDKALKYGPDPRNRVDVYSPAAGATGRPVVVYFHGGGLVVGDNDATPNIYANIGTERCSPFIPPPPPFLFLYGPAALAWQAHS